MHRLILPVFRAVLVLGPSLALLSGCSSSEKGLVPVSGKVTLDGGAWPKPGKIIFTPSTKNPSEGGEVRPAIADFDTDGSFTVSSYEGAAGLYPGEYAVAVECWEVPPGMSNPDAAAELGKKKIAPKLGMKMIMPGPGKSHVPAKYQNSSTSELVLKVEPGHSASANFDVKSK